MHGTSKQIGKGAPRLQHASFQALKSWPVGVCLNKKREMKDQVRRYRVEEALADVVHLCAEAPTG